MLLEPLFPSAVVASILLLWFLFVVVAYNASTSYSLAFFDQLSAVVGLPSAEAFLSAVARILLVVGIGLFAVLVGRTIWPAWKRLDVQPLERLLLHSALGAGVLIFLFLLTGAAGLLYRSVFIAFLTGGIAVLLFVHRDLFLRKYSPDAAKSAKSPSRSILAMIVAGASVLFLAVYLLEALAPEIFYDSLVYHLAVPKLWILHHRLFPTPTICYSGIPFNTEALFGIGLLLSDDIAAKLIHFLCGVGTIGAIYAIARRYSSALSGWIAALLFLSSPFVALEFGKTAVELGSSFFATTAMLAFLIGVDSSDGTLKTRAMTLAGILCGLAMGTKYTCWVFLPAFALALPWVARTGDSKISWNQVIFMEAMLCGSALLTLIPWLIKNGIFYHNPFYPFAIKFFPLPHGMATPDVSRLQGDAWGRDLSGDFLSWKGIFHFVLEPWTVTMSGKTDANFIGPLYLLLLPWLCLFKWRPAMKALFCVFFLTWLPTSFSSRLVRFWIPSLALLAALLGVVIEEGNIHPFLKRISLILLLILAGSNLNWGGLLLFSTDGWQAALGLTSRENYLNRPHSTYPTPYYSAAQFINTQTPASSRVVVLGDSRGFFIERPFLTASVFDVHPFIHWANECASGDELYQRMMSNHFTHILLNVAEAARLRLDTVEPFTEHGKGVLEEFWQKHLRAVFEDRGQSREEYRFTVVYECVPDRRSLESNPPGNPNYLLMILRQPKS